MTDDENEWADIYGNYLEYTSRYEDEGMGVKIGSEGLPLQSAALRENYHNISIQSGEGPLERELLLEHSNENPSVFDLNKITISNLPIGLTETLKVQTTKDHTVYWQLTADMIDDIDSESFSHPRELLEQFELLVALVLGNPGVQMGFPDRWSSEWMQDRILRESSVLASYSGFPILEGFLKSFCKEYITMNGVVKEGKRLQTFDTVLTEGAECSNIGHLLHHAEHVVAGPALADRLELMRERVADFYNPDWSDTYNWSKEKALGNGGLAGLRNKWLHGQEEAEAENGIILNYICLLLWDEILKNDSHSA